MKALYQLQHIRVPRCTSLRYMCAPLSTSRSGWRHIHPPLVIKNSVVCILIGCLATWVVYSDWLNFFKWITHLLSTDEIQDIEHSSEQYICHHCISTIPWSSHTGPWESSTASSNMIWLLDTSTTNYHKHSWRDEHQPIFIKERTQYVEGSA